MRVASDAERCQLLGEQQRGRLAVDRRRRRENDLRDASSRTRSRSRCERQLVRSDAVERRQQRAEHEITARASRRCARRRADPGLGDDAQQGRIAARIAADRADRGARLVHLRRGSGSARTGARATRSAASSAPRSAARPPASTDQEEHVTLRRLLADAGETRKQVNQRSQTIGQHVIEVLRQSPLRRRSSRALAHSSGRRISLSRAPRIWRPRRSSGVPWRGSGPRVGDRSARGFRSRKPSFVRPRCPTVRAEHDRRFGAEVLACGVSRAADGLRRTSRPLEDAAGLEREHRRVRDRIRTTLA